MSAGERAVAGVNSAQGHQKVGPTILCGTAGLRLLQQMAHGIPIVFVLVLDPVGEGYFASITGVETRVGMHGSM